MNRRALSNIPQNKLGRNIMNTIPTAIQIRTNPISFFIQIPMHTAGRTRDTAQIEN